MWFQIKEKTISIALFIKPNAKQSALVGSDDQALHIALHAKPVDGEANIALISFMSKLLSVPKSHITLLRGQTSRHKVIGLPLTQAVEAFLNSDIFKIP